MAESSNSLNQCDQVEKKQEALIEDAAREAAGDEQVSTATDFMAMSAFQ